MKSRLTAAVATLRRHQHQIWPVLWGPVLGMLGMAVGTRLLTEVTSAATFGEVKLVHGALALVLGLVARPLSQFAMREYHDADRQGFGEAFESHIKKLQLWLAVGVGSISVAVLLVLQRMGAPLGWAAVLTLLPTVVLEVVMQTRLAFALTRNQQRLVSVVETVKTWGLSLVAAAGMAWLLDSAAVFLALQAAFTAAVLVVMPRGAASSPAPVSELTRRAWNRGAAVFALPMLGTAVFNWMLQVGDRYLLSHYGTVEEVGRYSAVYGLTSAPVVALGGMAVRFLFPLVFRAASLQQEDRGRSLFHSQLLLNVVVGVGAVAGAVLFGPLVVSIILAPEYREGAVPVMIWVAAGHACLIVSFALEMRAYADKRVGALTLSTGVGAVTNLVLNMLWVPHEGALGAARATFFSFGVYLALNALLLWPRRARGEQASA